MIVIKLRGGLANQMFQYALGRYLSLKHNVPLKVDLIHYEKEQTETKTIREFGLSIFNIKARIASGDEVSNAKGWYDNTIKRKFNTLSNKFKPYYKVNIIKEKAPHFDANILDASDNCYIEGFWQSELYFKTIRSQILEDFEILKDPSEKNKDVLEDIINSNSISIHVRRGDYVTSEHYKHVHQVLDIDYYNAAIQLLEQRVKNPVYFVFSDDPIWAKAHIKPTSKTYYMDHNSSENGFEDLRLMQNCKHNVVANSSFSWWPAWLNDNPNKIVIAPKKWYKMENLENKDIAPDDWIKI